MTKQSPCLLMQCAISTVNSTTTRKERLCCSHSVPVVLGKASTGDVVEVEESSVARNGEISPFDSHLALSAHLTQRGDTGVFVEVCPGGSIGSAGRANWKPSGDFVEEGDQFWAKTFTGDVVEVEVFPVFPVVRYRDSFRPDSDLALSAPVLQGQVTGDFVEVTSCRRGIGMAGRADGWLSGDLSRRPSRIWDRTPPVMLSRWRVVILCGWDSSLFL